MKRWLTREAAEDAVDAVASACGLPAWLARILVARGFSEPGVVEPFLRPRLSQLHDPMLLPDMAVAVDRIWETLDRGGRVVVYGDYDVDGITSSALLKTVLEALGAQAVVFLPHRVDDGYGLCVEPVERCIQEHQPELIVTVDCGTNSAEAVEAAGKLGVDVVVTDHHEPAETVARPVALVNPKLGKDETTHGLAGVGVCFKLCHALLKRGRDRGNTVAQNLDIRPYLEWVAVGTIADVVPLVGDNRIMAHYGLGVLEKSPSTGLAALLKQAGAKPPLDSYHVGYVIGPRLNAAGRLGTARAALDLLLSQDADQARQGAVELDEGNRERRRIEAETLEAAIAQVEPGFDPERTFAVVAAGVGWHPGVIGIVASRLVRRFHRPALVLALEEDGSGKGSGRSIEGFSLVDSLDACSAYLSRHGGHAMAAGCTLPAGGLDAFRSAFEQTAAEVLQGRDLRPIQKIDAWIELGDLSEEALETLRDFGPFGAGNPNPVVAARRLRILGKPRVVGGKHLKLQLAGGTAQFDAIGFGMGDCALPDGPVDAVFQPRFNTFRGQRSIQLQLEDLRASE